MARFNEILAGRYNRALQKLFQLKGGPPSAQLASEIMPTFPLFNGVENRFLETWDRFGFGTLIGAVAANVSGFRFRNVPTSNLIAVFEKMTITVGTATSVNWFMDTTNVDLVSTSTASVRLDSRGRQKSSMIFSSQNTTPAIASAVNQFYNVSLPVTSPYEMILEDDQELTLLPGDALSIITNNVNILFGVAAIWRERALEESELKIGA